MTHRRAATAVFCIVFLGIAFFAGRLSLARDTAEQQARIDALRAEMVHALHAGRPAGTAGRGMPVVDDESADARATLRDEIKRELQAEMGLLPVKLLRDRRDSFVELYSYDNQGGSSYGTAGYLGRGYFVTVKHAVVALGDSDRRDPRRITSIRLVYKGRRISARVVDAGEAQHEVDPGDWAILKVDDTIALPPLRPNLDYAYSFADPIFRLGNDYSKGIILATGHVGQKTSSGLVTCLTDGHPGVSGGGVLSQQGDLVGIPVGRMQGDYRFSFILPLRKEMFRKVPIGALEGPLPDSSNAIANEWPAR
jgi:hypothetical protein